MHIQFPTNLMTPVLARLAATLPWSVNDILIAEVVGKTGENFTRLAIGGRVVVARTDALLEVGQKLTLKVESTATTTVMTVVPNERRTAASTVAQALARVLPRQATAEDTERLLRSLDALTQNTQALSNKLGRGAAATLTQDIQNLLKAMPHADQLTKAPQLRAAVEQAALPTEARLLSAVQGEASPDISSDVRAHFARLAAALATLPPAARAELDRFVHQTLHAHVTSHVTSLGEAQSARAETAGPPPTATASQHHVSDFKTLIESVVARLEANQLQTLANAPTNPVPLMIDLPVTREGHTDLLHMEVESDGRQTDDDSPPRTSVTLNLKLDSDHDFSARLQLSGDTLSVRLGSTDVEFNAKITARITELEDRLRDAGLEVKQIFIAPLSVSSRPRVGTQPLINERV